MIAKIKVKKLLVLLLCLVMVIGISPVSAFANPGGNDSGKHDGGGSTTPTYPSIDHVDIAKDDSANALAVPSSATVIVTYANESTITLTRTGESTGSSQESQWRFTGLKNGSYIGRNNQDSDTNGDNRVVSVYISYVVDGKTYEYTLSGYDGLLAGLNNCPGKDGLDIAVLGSSTTDFYFYQVVYEYNTDGDLNGTESGNIQQTEATSVTLTPETSKTYGENTYDFDSEKSDSYTNVDLTKSKNSPTDPVVIRLVYGRTTPTPAVPEKPVATDINGLNDKVQVECETDTENHLETLYGLTDFTISDVKETEGSYYVTLTVPAKSYVEKYVNTYGEHTQVATDPESKDLIATFDGERWSIASADKVVFHVECTTSSPDATPDPDPIIPTHYYTVKWNNYDNSNLETDYCVYYQMPTYDSATPVKPDDDEFTYEFIGWDKEIVRVTKDEVYTAQFRAIAKEQPEEPAAEPGDDDNDKPVTPDKPSKPSKPDQSGTDSDAEQTTTVPKTGDEQNPTLWIALMAAALAGLGATRKLKKKA